MRLLRGSPNVIEPVVEDISFPTGPSHPMLSALATLSIAVFKLFFAIVLLVWSLVVMIPSLMRIGITLWLMRIMVFMIVAALIAWVVGGAIAIVVVGSFLDY
jgi:hypothetical protein